MSEQGCRFGQNIFDKIEFVYFQREKKSYIYIFLKGVQFDPWIPILPEINIGEGVQLGYPLDVLDPQQQDHQRR